MERSIEQLRSQAPSIVLMGMRGAGKTTLGRLAAEHLHTTLIDADVLFEERHASTPKAFVAQHGWPAFRAAETTILKELLGMLSDRTRTEPYVVSLGGGIVEAEQNRTLLKRSWMMEKQEQEGDLQGLDRSKGIAVIHVFREVDKVLLDRRGLPSWTGMANGEEVWQRRRPWFRESSSHEFINFTDGDVMEHADAVEVGESTRAARMRFEAVERDFVRFLVSLLCSFRSDSQAYMPDPKKRSYLVTFPFADLKPHVDKLPLITLGADAVELRADLLHDPSVDRREDGSTEAYENPSLSFVSEQVALVRRHLPGVPLVFTLRTPAQGGRYPYPANAPTQALFTTLRHALKLNCDVIDIEMGLNERQTHSLIQDAKQRRVTVLVSWRDKIPSSQGGFSWTSNRATALYDTAVDMGADIAKIVGTAGQVSDNFALRLFAASLEECGRLQKVPLSAYNMGYEGRISRFLNTTLASVTHPIAKQFTSRGVIGNPSMTFEEIQKALHLSGLTQQSSFVVIEGEGGGESVDRYRHWFEQMGLPFHVHLKGWSRGGIDKLIEGIDPLHGDLRGVAFSQGIASDFKGEETRWECDENVAQTGHLDCILLDVSGTAAAARASNKLVEALTDLITSSISPSIHLSSSSSCIILGDEGRGLRESSAWRAAQNAGLVGIKLQRGADEARSGDNPTIIINSGKPFDERLLANVNGGLYIDLADNADAQRLIGEKRFRNAGWRSIPAEDVWRHVDALRFQNFTGRRAPSRLSDRKKQ